MSIGPETSSSGTSAHTGGTGARPVACPARTAEGDDPSDCAGTFVAPRGVIASMMHRIVAVVAALSLVQATALSAGTFCNLPATATTVPAHAHGMPGMPQSSGHDHRTDGAPAHCALMASCSMMTVGTLVARVAPATGLHEQVPAARQFAPRSVHAAPEPPPPKA